MPDFDPAPRRALRQDTTPVAAADDNPLAPRKGSTSADAVKREKAVKVKIKVPKSLRNQLEREASDLGITVDEVIARRLS